MATGKSSSAGLSDAEKLDIVKLIEEGKPLPDKYRFLLFEDKREVELVWNGKNTEVCQVVLPFQVIEQVDEPRRESAKSNEELFKHYDLSLDGRGRQLKGWENKLIWGDNKWILSSLKNGPLREKIDQAGGLKLIYIDPPFDVGADFSMDIEVGGETFTKKPNILEEIAYRDTWGRGADSFIAMIYERLILMRDVLAEDGSIYVHCDWRMNSYLRLALDEVFGKENFRNEIVWHYRKWSNAPGFFQRNHDILLSYSKSDNPTFNPQYYLSDDKAQKLKKGYQINVAGGKRQLIYYDASKIGDVCPKRYDVLTDRTQTPIGVLMSDTWNDINILNSQANERINYPTQKPEALLERIVKASSNEGDLVADFFCGSGTLAAVAEKLGRKWVCSDLGKFAIHTTRKRIIGVQRQLKGDEKPYRAFEILNLGKYERQHYVRVNPNLREAEQAAQRRAREADFLKLILRAYSARAVHQFDLFHGEKAGRMVVVGPMNMPVSSSLVEEVMDTCLKHRITQVDLLGFEFEMGMFPNAVDVAKSKGLDMAPKYIPREVFDKRAVEKGQVVFHNVAYIEVKSYVEAREVAVELVDFSVFYSQDSLAHEEAKLKKGSKIIVDGGQVVKISKDKEGGFKREALTRQWTDWVDYWSVDFDFESKQEIISTRDEQTGDTQESWTGDYIFENEWQSFRTRKNREIELKTPWHDLKTDKSRQKIAVKVVDIFGNDTLQIVEVGP